MPYRLKKNKNGWSILKKNSQGKWRVVGHSRTKKKAEAARRARYANSKE